MSHTLHDLSMMSREQLESVAAPYDIKGIKKLDDEHLAYSILDAEAKEISQKALPIVRRRGRPSKQSQENSAR